MDYGNTHYLHGNVVVTHKMFYRVKLIVCLLNMVICCSVLLGGELVASYCGIHVACGLASFSMNIISIHICCVNYHIGWH